MKQSSKVALGGIFSALALVCMMLTVIPALEFSLPALAGVVLIPVVLELGVPWGWLSYVCVGILSLLIAPNMEAKVLFVAFFGYYPIVKALIERLRKQWAEWLIKLGIFNITMVAAYALMLYVFQLPLDSFELFGVNMPLVFLALGNVVFVIYDVALTGIVTMYIRVLHPKLSRIVRR